MSNHLARICADLGVEIINGAESAVRPGQTTARATLHKMLHQHGEGHLVTVLRAFTETENNEARIDAFTIWALSDIINAHPEWPETGLRWLEVLDGIDIAGIQSEAKENRDAVPQRHAIATMLSQQLSRAFAKPQSIQTRENVMPIDNDLLFGHKAIAAFLQIPRHRIGHMITSGAVPTFRMPGASTICARKSTLNALWAQYEQQQSEQRMAG